VKMRFALMLTLVVLVLGLASPAFAQEQAAAAVRRTELVRWSIITAASRWRSRRLSAPSLRPRASARRSRASRVTRGGERHPRNLILGLVLIESLVIYVLLVSLILFFVKPFGG